MSEMITCSICGHQFDPSKHAACSHCPLQKGCQMVCCPNCGFETVDIHQSRMVQIASALFRNGKKKEGKSPQIRKERSGMALLGWPVKNRVKSAGSGGKDGASLDHHTPGLSLVNILPGSRARIVAFSNKISPERRAHLQAYGLVPGRWVAVFQHSPVTIIQVEHTELALETDLAAEIQVDRDLPGQGLEGAQPA